MQLYAVDNLAYLPYETADEPLFVIHVINSTSSIFGDQLEEVNKRKKNRIN